MPIDHDQSPFVEQRCRPRRQAILPEVDSSGARDGGGGNGGGGGNRPVCFFDDDDDEEERRRRLAAEFGSLVPHMNSEISTSILTAIKRYLLEFPKQFYNRIKMWITENPKLCLCVLLALSAPLTAHLIGFTAAGIAAGSIAAAIQSSIGSVVAGSFFALMQSITATGLLATLSCGIVGGLVGLTAFLTGLQKGGWLRRFCSYMTGTLGSWWTYLTSMFRK